MRSVDVAQGLDLPRHAVALVLAGGRVFANEADAIAAGVRLGQLTSVNVHADLTGAGHPTAVVGSSDGWLYGVDLCARTKDFAVAFPAPVGALAMPRLPRLRTSAAAVATRRAEETDGIESS